jgi:hypothetical protein
MRIDGSARDCSSATVYSAPVIHSSANTFGSSNAAAW